MFKKNFEFCFTKHFERKTKKCACRPTTEGRWHITRWQTNTHTNVGKFISPYIRIDRKVKKCLIVYLGAVHSVSSPLVKYNIIVAPIFLTFRKEIGQKKFDKNGFHTLQSTMSHRPLTKTSSLKIAAAYCLYYYSRSATLSLLSWPSVRCDDLCLGLLLLFRCTWYPPLPQIGSG